MNVTLTLSPRVEEGLMARAHARGVSLDDHLQELVAREAGVAGANLDLERSQDFERLTSCAEGSRGICFRPDRNPGGLSDRVQTQRWHRGKAGISEREPFHPVHPLLCFSEVPNQEEVFDHFPDRDPFGHEYQTCATALLNALVEPAGHGVHICETRIRPDKCARSRTSGSVIFSGIIVCGKAKSIEGSRSSKPATIF